MYAILSDAEGEVSRAEAHVDLDVARRSWCCPYRPIAATSGSRATRSSTWTCDFALRGPGGELVDAVVGYAGLRTVSIDGQAVLINGERVFQRLVLDQGWYPDGLMTAPDDAALVRDIELAMEAGFNGARLHQKVFEERFLFHADHLGYLVWGEFGDWGARVAPGPEAQQPTASFITQWLEVLERDYSHPSIIGWCPLDETFQPLSRPHHRARRRRDSGCSWRPRRQTPRARCSTPPDIPIGSRTPTSTTRTTTSRTLSFSPRRWRDWPMARPYVNAAPDGTSWSLPYAGQPYFCSEFGGIQWSSRMQAEADAWGYGTAPRTEEEWYVRFAGLVDALLDNPLMFGYCFTQLTDVFQEQNGVFRFDRSAKFDISRIRAIQSRPAAYETGGA